MNDSARTINALRRLILSSALMLLCVVPVLAQSDTGRLEGTVTDQTGAVVPGATVTATNVGTNKRAVASTNAAGEYVIPALQVGRYNLEATAPSFKTASHPDIELEVNQVARIDLQLEPGAVSETVTIPGGAPLVDVGTSALGEVVQGRQIIDLPLNGRNVLELARLVPGVTQGVPGGFATGAGGNAETFRGRNTGGAALSVNGQRTQANNFLLDGVDNNESLVNTIQIFPQADAVQEFRVQTSVAPAEFGRGGGGIINAVIRSGRNDFFGSAFLFLRNSALDARPTYDLTKHEFRRGQFGGSVGGPLYLPRFGEGGPATIAGKNKLFFFADYEGLRQFLPVGTDTATVPTAAFRTGDFSALLNPAISGLSAPIQLIDPLTGLPIPGNRLDLLPGNRLNPVGLNYLNAFPLPNFGTGVIGNYKNTRNEITHQNNFDIRIDGNISQNEQAFGRISYGRAIQTTTTRLTTLPSGFGSGSNFARTSGVVLGLTSVLTQKTVNEFRIQASRINFGYEPPFFNTRLSADLGIPGANPDPLRGGGALIGGFNSQIEYTGDFGLYDVPENTYQVVDNVGHTTGNHSFRFGTSILRRNVNLFRPNRGKGYFFLFGNGADPASSGFEQADLLIGFVNNYQIGPPFGDVGTWNWENGFYGQDDWRVNHKLTLNLGLRYEIYTNPVESFNRQTNFDINTGQLLLAGANGNSRSLINNDYHDFGPRLGFAYDINGNGRSVLRGGYGVFYFLDRGGIDNQLAQNPPFSGFSQFNYSNGFRITLSGAGPLNNNDSRLATGALPTGDVSGVSLTNPQNVSVLAILPNIRTPRTQQFNIQYQRQLSRDTALSVGYVGTRANHLSSYYNLNGTPLGGGPVRFPSLGSVTVRDDTGRSRYDSLQVQVERRFTRGLQYLASYTLSKTKDNAFDAFNAPGNGGLFVREAYGRSAIDFPHVFSFSSIYDLPLGRGRKYGADMPRAVNWVVGGFQLNSILRLQSGQPFDVRTNNNNGVLVDLVGSAYGGPNSAYLNPAAFANPPTVGGIPTRIGTLPRNGLRAPWQKQLNLGLSKNFGINEASRIQFRTEFFNVFNTPQLGVPNTNLSDPSFGQFQSTYLFTNRQIQFGLRYEF